MQLGSHDMIVKPNDVCKGAVQMEEMSGAGLAFPDSSAPHSVHPSQKLVNPPKSGSALTGWNIQR